MRFSALCVTFFLIPSAVIASLVDITPPELLGLTITPNLVDVTSGEQNVDVTFEFSDDLIGSDYIYLTVYDPLGKNIDSAWG
jgi:hypothetical protein